MEPFLSSLFVEKSCCRTNSEKKTEKYASAAALSFQPGNVIAVKGDLGAGKTVFVKGIAGALGGAAEEVASPTFTILREIQGLKNRAGIKKIYHFDFYRLKDFRELENTGYREMLGMPDSLIIAEWPERVAETAADFSHLYMIEHLGGDLRKITEYVGKKQYKGV